MRLVSPFLKHVVYPGLSRAGYLRRAAGIAPVVVTYHGVLPQGYEIVDPDLDGNLVSAEAFRNQLRFLTTHYNVIDPEDFRLWCQNERELPPRSVLLTGDDGLLNTATDMLPILQESRLPCLFFVTGASLLDTATMLWHEELYLMFLQSDPAAALDLAEIGVSVRVTGRQQKRQLWWELVKHFSRVDSVLRCVLLEQVRTQLGFSERWKSAHIENDTGRRRFSLLTQHGVRQLLVAGMCIGAHAVSHPVLSQLSPELAWKEIVDSRRSLEAALGQEVWALAYPFGDPFSVGSRELEMAKCAGFTCAFLNVEHSHASTMNTFALPRVHVTANMALPEFEAHISGFHSSLQRFLSNSRVSNRMDHLAPCSA